MEMKHIIEKLLPKTEIDVIERNYEKEEWLPVEAPYRTITINPYEWFPFEALYSYP